MMKFLVESEELFIILLITELLLNYNSIETVKTQNERKNGKTF